ncbi:MAG: hypothetical protein RL758_91 [Pseudomonadota bacterium]|jgi:hypothetical protein
MSTQSEALRLADALEDSLEDYSGSSLPRRCQNIADEAAAELRRLHDLNAELLEALKKYDEAFNELGDGMESRHRMRLAVIKARAAIAKATRETK